MRAELVIRIRVAAAFRGMTFVLMPAGRGLLPLADIADPERSDGGPELVIGRKDAVIPMPMLPRRRDEIGEPVQELKRRELDDAIGPRPRGRSRWARTDRVGGLVSGEHVADFGCAAACVMCHRESLERKGWPISDEVVELDWKSKHRTRPDHPVRLICVAVKPHESSRGWKGPHCDGVLRLVTNRLDLPAELIAEMVRLRWVIEMFFRTFKQLLGCGHLFSDKHNGVEIQAYCAMIVCMLILISTGEKPNRAMYQMVWYYLIGLASLKELEAFIRTRR